MKVDEIKDAALKFFTIHGYEGASLSQIAEEVGMKKQSLYAHFKGKDDLFLQVLRDAKEAERASKLEYMSGFDEHHPERDLYGFLRLVIDLFQKNEQLKFWLRTSFFPPKHIWPMRSDRKSSTSKPKFRAYSNENSRIGSIRRPSTASRPKRRRLHSSESSIPLC